MLPVLQVLRTHGDAMPKNELCTAVMDAVELSEEQRGHLYETSGDLVAKDRIDWAISLLKIAGALERPGRAVYALGPNADRFLELGRPISKRDLTQTQEWQQHQEERSARGRQQGPQAAAQLAQSADADPVSSAATPEEMMESASRQLNGRLAEDLLESVKDMQPEAFERLVLKVLAALGYGGGDPRAIQGVRRGPDGGIDGKIKEDRLGLDQIYVQSKRYGDNSVSAPEVRSFIGSMARDGCKKGVFVTSSRFTREAIGEVANMADYKLSLIDGHALAQLMIDHGVGIQVTGTYKVARVDRDFFGDD